MQRKVIPLSLFVFALLIALPVSNVRAAALLDFEEMPSGVVATLSGYFNLAGLTPDLTSLVDLEGPGVDPDSPDVLTNNLVAQDPSHPPLLFSLSGPGKLGPGQPFVDATSSSADSLMLDRGIDLILPPSYISNTILSGSMIFDGLTLSQMGLASGDYVFYLGNQDSLTIRVGAVPLPATLPLFASGLAGLGWLSRRKRKQAA